ncbi:MAG TPA: hypothetical protein VFG54_21140 [Prolixibacteraceae bacterium]|nr:hypothetical protein [Prolixibacteraceae bacterium]
MIENYHTVYEYLMKANKTRNSSSSNRNMSWVLISGIFFLLSFIASAVLILYGKKLEALGIVGNIYYIILIPLGFSSAAFLAGAMKSYASFQSNETMPYGKLHLTGPIVIFVLVVGGGFIMPNINRKETFSLKVRVVSDDKATNLFNEGQIILYIGPERKSEDIHHGEAKFENIPETYANKKVKLDLIHENYQLANRNEVIISKNEDYIDIKVVKTAHVTEVRGSVINDDHAPVKNAFINFGSGLATGYTDQNGDFLLTVPLSSGEKVALKVSVDNITRFNETVTLSQTTPINLILKLKP